MTWSTIQSMIISAFERAVHSKALALYSAILVTGLGTARFGYSAAFSILKSSSTEGNVKQFTQSTIARPVTQTRIDPQALIGGNLFADVLTISDFQGEEEAPPEIKNFILLGTLEGHWSFARAVIQIVGSNEPAREYAIGNTIGAAKIIDIGREKIWIRINGEKRMIKVGETTADANRPSTPTASTEGDMTVITRVLLRQEVNEKIKGNPEDIYRGAKWGPIFVDGKIAGFKIHRLSSNHIFFALGARSGDVIKSVNGFPLSNTERMLELWNNVTTMDRVQIVIERDNKLIKYDFHIRN